MNSKCDLDTVILSVGIFKMLRRTGIIGILRTIYNHFESLKSFGTKQELFVIRSSVFCNLGFHTNESLKLIQFTKFYFSIHLYIWKNVTNFFNKPFRLGYFWSLSFFYNIYIFFIVYHFKSHCHQIQYTDLRGRLAILYRSPELYHFIPSQVITLKVNLSTY